MIRCLLKRHVIWEHSDPGAAQAPSCSVSWTVSGWSCSYVGSEDVRISESWWEVEGNQTKSIIFLYFAVRGYFLDLLQKNGRLFGGHAGEMCSFGFPAVRPTSPNVVANLN